MGTRLVKAEQLNSGDVLALPFGQTALITTVSVGTTFVNLRLDGLPKTRVERGSEHSIIDTTGCQWCGEGNGTELGPIVVIGWDSWHQVCKDTYDARRRGVSTEGASE